MGVHVLSPRGSTHLPVENRRRIKAAASSCSRLQRNSNQRNPESDQNSLFQTAPIDIALSTGHKVLQPRQEQAVRDPVFLVLDFHHPNYCCTCSRCYAIGTRLNREAVSKPNSSCIPPAIASIALKISSVRFPAHCRNYYGVQ